MTYKGAMSFLLALCAMAYLNHPHFAAQAAEVRNAVAQIPDHQTQEQMLLPVALSHLLPAGVRGALCVILMMGLFGGDGAALHSWGSLFIQDILVPLQRKPYGPKQHILYLRVSILGVALFSFVFGILFRQTDYLLMWWSITGAVFVGGAGAAIIGGLYWSKGTATGAWAAMVTGSFLSVGGIILREINPNFPLNGLQNQIIVTLIAAMTYVVVSLLTLEEAFNMDRMLHRGAYATLDERASKGKSKAGLTALLIRLIGIDENFNRGDKWLAISVFVWAVLWFLVFVFGTIWNLASPWPTPVWSEFWLVTALYIPIVLTVIVAFWFTWGSLRDMNAFFYHLRKEHVDVRDDGTVIDHRNLGESNVEQNVEPAVEPPVINVT
jgi:SSS family solute:Na+ symporter